MSLKQKEEPVWNEGTRRILNSFQSHLAYWTMKRDLKFSDKEIETTCHQAAQTGPLRSQLEGFLMRKLQQIPESLSESLTSFKYTWGELPPIPMPSEPLDHFSKARKKLEQQMCQRLKDLSVELKMPLARLRSTEEQEEYVKRNHLPDITKEFQCEKEKEKEPVYPKPKPINYALYDEDDLLNAIHQITNGNHVDTHPKSTISGFSFYWPLSNIGLYAKGLEELRIEFQELHPTYRHIGLDNVYGATGTKEEYLDTRIEMGKKIVASGRVVWARLYSRHGIPGSLRANMWLMMLETEAFFHRENDVNHYCQKLTHSINTCELLVDTILFQDVQKCLDDDTYFLFDEMLNKILLYWSRDTWLRPPEAFAASAPSPTNSDPKNPPVQQYFGKAIHCASSFEPLKALPVGAKTPTCYPTNGIMPFWGMCYYAMPLCYLFKDAEMAYFCFREMYARYFCRLHVLSSDEYGLASLTHLFDTLLQQTEPTLYMKLHVLEISPTSIAFKWICRGYVGFLAVEQLLLLWDRILGFAGGTKCGPDKGEGLQLLSILAVTIFQSKLSLLEKAKNQKEVMNILSDLEKISVIPLLQYYMFHDHLPSKNVKL